MFFNLVLILTLGVSAQWLAWRLKVPSILILLLFGFVAGPIGGWLHPDKLFGELLFPWVAICVSFILFEGGLCLKWHEFRRVGWAAVGMVTIGAFITWLMFSVTVKYLLGFGWELSILLGAICIVTGPTVIMPLLQQLRPSRKPALVLKWEAMLNDPIGAIVAVLTLEAILSGGTSQAFHGSFLRIFETLGYGILWGSLAAGLMLIFLKKHWIPDYLHTAVTLMFVSITFFISNEFQAESGLVAVTLMGMVLTNQKITNIQHIIDFKENLRVLLIASLFIVLAARVNLADLKEVAIPTCFSAMVLILIIRPIAVFGSTFRSGLSKNEKIFLSFCAPRGIVAAAIASIFSLRLSEAGYAGAEKFSAVIFIIIVFTVLAAGIIAPQIAYRLGVANRDPQGLVILGAHTWARIIAKEIKSLGFQVCLIDSNEDRVWQATRDGLRAYYGNAASEHDTEMIDLEGMGRFLGLTPNVEANSIAASKFSKLFESSQVYQLSPQKDQERKQSSGSVVIGKILFPGAENYETLTSRFLKGKIVRLQVEESGDWEQLRGKEGSKSIPLFVVKSNGKLNVLSNDDKFSPTKGDTIILLKETDEGV